MIDANKMNDCFDKCIADYHLTDDVDASFKNPFQSDSFEALVYHKCWIDTVQWHLEDIIRDPNIIAENALLIKRRIDSSNQDRTDRVEMIDDYYLELFEGVKPQDNCRINTESPAWAIDRLSILALKIYHMKIEAQRSDIAESLLAKNKFKYQVLLTQREDLSQAISELLEDLKSGSRVMKVYRQMKMYNDPELNPVLYSKSK